MTSLKKITAFVCVLALTAALCLSAYAEFFNEEPTAEQRAYSDRRLDYEYRSLFSYESITAEGFETTLDYRLYVPEDYDPEIEYPVILFLHGAGESNNGSNTNEAQLNVGMMDLFFRLGYYEKFPCIIVAPQVPKEPKNFIGEWVNTNWMSGSYKINNMTGTGPTFTENIQLAKMAVDKVIEDYNVDTDRIYATGISMGGYGTWNIITHYSDFFAAAMPICGAGDPSKADYLTEMPIWCFHGDEDTAVPTSGSRDMYNAITAAGGEKIRYTEWIKTGHAWLPAYCREDVWMWLFSQSKGETHVSTSAAQISNDNSEIRFIAAVDGLDYQSVGFTVTAQKDGEQGKQTVTDNTVYSAIEAENGTFTAESFAIEDGYIFMLTVKDLPEYTKFTVNAIAVTQDGETVKGSITVFSVGEDPSEWAPEIAGTNVAFSGTASDCGVEIYQAGNESSTINDGEKQSGGYQPKEWQQGDWVALIFDEAYDVNGLYLYWENAQYIDPLTGDGYEVYTKTPGVDEWTLVDKSDVDFARVIYSDPTIKDAVAFKTPVNTDGIKIVFINKHIDNQKFTPKLYELEVFAADE